MLRCDVDLAREPGKAFGSGAKKKMKKQ